jgi:hypothetical protein
MSAPLQVAEPAASPTDDQQPRVPLRIGVAGPRAGAPPRPSGLVAPCAARR